MTHQGKGSLNFLIAVDSGVTIFHLFIYLFFFQFQRLALSLREKQDRVLPVCEKKKKRKEKNHGSRHVLSNKSPLVADVA